MLGDEQDPVRWDSAGVQPGDRHVPKVRERQRLRRRDPGVPADGGLRPVLGIEQTQVLWHDASVQSRRRCLPEVHQ